MRRLLGLTLAAALVATTLLVLTTSQALANHVYCGDVITQDTTLDSDLSCSSTPGLVIGADNITLDLGGHVLSGPGFHVESDAVDNTAGHDGVTIENGTVRQFGSAVQLADATHNAVRGISGDTGSLGNPAGIVLERSHDNLIDDNALSAYPLAISLNESDRNRIVGNSLFGSGGIELSSDSTKNRIENNKITIQYDSGIDVSFSDDNSIDGNSVVNCGSRSCYGWVGVRISNSNRTSVTKNVVVQLYDGIVLSQSDDGRVDRNRVIEGGAYDAGEGFCRICVIDSNNNRIIRNFTYRAPSYGILIDGTSTGNQVLRNVANRDYQDGIRVQSNTRETLLKDNVANQSYEDGIHVESTFTTLTGNTANENLDLGIEAVFGVDDGGRNTASGNGNPLQCLNVVCKTN